MATTAATVMASIETAIKAITPTDEPGLKFALASDKPGTPEEQSVSAFTERHFEVWHGGGEEPANGYHTASEYEADELLRVMVSYPIHYDRRALDRRIRSDVRDIKAALDAQANWGTDVLHQLVRRWPEPSRLSDRFIQELVVEVQFIEAA